MFKSYETELAGRKLVIETGKMAELSNGSVVVRYGETVVMVNVTASKEPREGIDFFPLSVDYEEKLYAVGKIPGSFQKREGKPADKAILTSRAIDRPLRPLFPKDFRNDVVVVATVLSVEQDNSPEVAAMIGASAALSISDIPFGGPTAAVNVGLVDGKIIINPTEEQRKVSDLTLTVAGTEGKIAMIEAGANEVPDDVMLEAIKAGHVEIKKMCKFIEKIKEEIEHRKLVVRPEAIEAVKEARAQGDLSENFEYYAAKKDKNKNEGRIRYLERVLKTATIISDESADDEVGLNNTVQVYFEDDDETETFKIVSTMRGDSISGRISGDSPMGAALMGHKVGDRVEVKVNEKVSYYVVIKSIENTGEEETDTIRTF